MFFSKASQCNSRANYWSVIPWWLSGKESTCNSGGVGLICESRRSPGGGHCNPLQYSCLENPMDRGTWRATILGITKSQIQLRNWAHTLLSLVAYLLVSWIHFSFIFFSSIFSNHLGFLIYFFFWSGLKSSFLIVRGLKSSSEWGRLNMNNMDSVIISILHIAK